MWLQLKSENADVAWSDLITAQGALRDAIRAHSRFEELSIHAERLKNLEKIVFPTQVFVSAGMIVRLSVCSICGACYDECDHIVGRPYMGALCRRRLSGVEVDHIAIVSNPANKHCRVTHFNDNGGRRNRMTWTLEADLTDGSPRHLDDPLHAESIILANDGSDLVFDQ